MNSNERFQKLMKLFLFYGFRFSIPKYIRYMMIVYTFNVRIYTVETTPVIV